MYVMQHLNWQCKDMDLQMALLQSSDFVYVKENIIIY